MAKLRFQYRDDQINARIDLLRQKLHISVGAIMDYYSLKATGYLKTGAPWTDRTGAARTGLHALSSSSGSSYSIVMAHSVAYGIWLEVKFSGRDAIIMPTVRKVGDEVMVSLQGLMGRI